MSMSPFPPQSGIPFKSITQQPLLEAIQGNILKGHGRPHVRLLFFRFARTSADNQKLLPAAVADQLVTSAWTQYQQTASGNKDECFYGLGLTSRFFDSARMTPAKEALSRLFGSEFTDPQFLLRPEPGDWWEYVFWNVPDGVWLLAHEKKEALDSMEKKVVDRLAKHDAALFGEKEDGFLWMDAPTSPRVIREPFGFRDGLSNAVFLDDANPPRVFSAAEQKHVQMPLSQVLLSPGDRHEGGSLMVLMKLQQNVKAFREFEQKVAQATAAVAGQSPAEAGALLVGRHRDGTPLAPNASAGNLNDFEFKDQKFRGCPFHAHIRKSNPRADDVKNNPEQRQIVRRSVVYDTHGQLPPWASPNYPEGDRITGDVGLLFMAYMSKVDQFGTMFANWFTSPTFPYDDTEMKDVLIRGGTASSSKDWSWDGVVVKGLPRFVKSRGALNLYVPSLNWLKQPS